MVCSDARDACGRDAGAHETQAACDGHPRGQGIYHYHTYSPCLPAKASQRPGSSTLAGYALDSYGIYPERDDHGNLPADADPDACHGRTSAITRDGKRVVMYHYDVALMAAASVAIWSRNLALRRVRRASRWAQVISRYLGSVGKTPRSAGLHAVQAELRSPLSSSQTQVPSVTTTSK